MSNDTQDDVGNRGCALHSSGNVSGSTQQACTIYVAMRAIVRGDTQVDKC
jgi:hypothetical protein